VVTDPFIIDGPCLWSFSGGRTSAYMLWRALQAYGGQLPSDHVVAFANTGREHDETLKFVDRCATHFGINVVWLEAVTRHNQRASSGHRIVSFETASRAGEPFEQMIQKYGIPNKSFLHCTRELKANAIKSYLQDGLGWLPNSYKTLIGIRADEADRATNGAAGVEYPLVRAWVRKADVYSFWKRQPFDLYIPEELGNCLDCHKKSFRKLLTIAARQPEVFDWSRRMEAQYGLVGAEFRKLERPAAGYRRVFFRNGMSADDIVARAKLPFEPFVDGRQAYDPDMDSSGGACGEESCEIDDLFSGAAA
jgi:hypothetical protein